MFDLIKGLLEIAKSLLGMSEQLKAAERQRREDLAKLFESISDSLADIVTKLRAGETTHRGCAELLAYAQELPGAIRAEVGDERADELGKLLREAYGSRSASMILTEESQKAACVNAIDEACGQFKALAKLIRIK